MTLNGAIARIIVRYGVGAGVGASVAQGVLESQDLMLVITAVVSVAVGGITEWAYKTAKRKGWTT